jgi:exo-1,4-beta-D-glucosaminidase
MLLRIRNHPSLVHFLGHDETFPTENLDNAYQELIAKYTPERTYQPHSGAFDIENRFKTGGTRTGTLELWTYAYPSHYYTHKTDGAWGFAQSGGIGGIFAPYSSIIKMMPEEKIWPPYNETFSFHSVLQGIHYFDVVMDAMQKRYGKIEDAKQFVYTGMILNYESARGMYEAYGRNKFDALGITTWKYDAAWPAALTWQYVDWYLNVGGAYYGAKKACEPLHVQYAYDDESVYVINNYFEDYEDLKVEAKVLDINMKEVFVESKQVSINENSKSLVFPIQVPNDISTTYFLSLKLRNKNDSVVSDNFYWLSTKKDIEGVKKEVPIFHQGRTWHVFAAEQESYADFTSLRDLSKVKVNMDYFVEPGEKENTVSVFLENPSQTIAFGINLSLVKSLDGEEILPAYWDDNYFSLLPGESRTVKVRYKPIKSKNKDVDVLLKGWNVL